MLKAKWSLSLCLLVFLGCDLGSKRRTNRVDLDAAVSDPTALRSIDVTPGSPVLFIDNQKAVTQDFTATGTHVDGTTVDLTSKVTFAIDKADLGTFAKNTFTSNKTGGFTTVSAKLGNQVGQTILTLVPRRLDDNGQPLDFFFIAPYQDLTSPASAVFSFDTKIRQADIAFVIDTTGSMSAKIDNLSQSLSSLTTTLQAQIPSVAIGVSVYDSWPCQPDGNSSDYLWQLSQRVITVQGQGLAAVQSTLAGLVANNGGDSSEPGFDALWAAATGLPVQTCRPSSTDNIVEAFDDGTAPGAVAGETTGNIGGMGFRSGALPLLVLVTDAELHDVEDPADTGFASLASVAHGHLATLQAVQQIGGRVIGIASKSGGFDFPNFAAPATGAPSQYEPYDQLVWLAEQTNTSVPPSAFGGVCGLGMCCTGENGSAIPPDAMGNCPLVFQVNESGQNLGTSVAAAISKLITYGGFDDTTKVVGKMTDESNPGIALPAKHTTADFLAPVDTQRGIVPLSSTPAVGSLNGPKAISNNSFIDVKPGTTLQFTVRAYNDFIPGTDQPQFFKATIQVIGSDTTLLDSRDVYILVPPAAVSVG